MLFLVVSVVFTSLNAQTITQSLETVDDDPYYLESKLFQKASYLFQRQKYAKARDAYLKCLEAGVIHPIIKIQLIECLERNGEFDQFDRYLDSTIAGISLFKQTPYFLNYEVKQLIREKEFARAKEKIISVLSDPVFTGDHADSAIIGILYAHLGYCKIFGQNEANNLIRAFDIADTSGTCIYTSQVDYLDAICNYTQAIKFGCTDTTIYGNLFLLEKLVQNRIDKDYQLPLTTDKSLKPIAPKPFAVSRGGVNYILPGRNAQFEDVLTKMDEIVFLLDYSLSMSEMIRLPNSGKMTREKLMKVEVLSILDDLKNYEEHNKDSFQTGLITIDDCMRPAPVIKEPLRTKNYDVLSAKIKRMELVGQTPLNKRLKEALDMFSGDTTAEKAVILFSDGIDLCSRNPRGTCYILEDYIGQNIKIIVYNLFSDPRKDFEAYGVYDCLSSKSNGALISIDQDYNLVVEQKAVNRYAFTTFRISQEEIYWDRRFRQYRLKEL